MATASVGMIGGNGCAGSSSSWFQIKNRKKKNQMARDRVKFFCVSSSSAVMDPYKTLRIQPGASESEVKKAFRQLALQYHPDVCRGSNCGVQFSRINEAYDIVMSSLRGEADESHVFESSYEPYDQGVDEPMRGMDDPDWDMWEEWMGWEGAGIRDYTSHINPYI
ncbi:chaperone protein dnaJ 8, chloroplastic [Ricinus communis]|uniref:Chaperone protein dnaJ 8, chloroplast, putative n=1 Tax=Ricinus communis TaxID=3988 RepID=B9RGM8_RICCO|nr:chaperone protein dnaJ 8, chloroplastic [Ricinus communis]EEF49240.1 Chaperone protein dnaJ 8, chloroplast precursor, putative [Ricinus communis]|eukprot:XP_002512737.1 chaperone protein dnaJ 8, chloroplastic [Ricinus communis]